MLVSVFCNRNELVKCVECICSEDSVAFRGVEAGKGEGRDATCIPRVPRAFVFDLIVVGVCCRIAWRMVWVMNVVMRESGMLVEHLVCLLARRSRP